LHRRRAVQQAEHFEIAQFVNQFTALIGRSQHDNTAQPVGPVTAKPVAHQNAAHRMGHKMYHLIAAGIYGWWQRPFRQYGNRVIR